MTKIVTVADPEVAASAIVHHLGGSKLIRIEGFCGAGKSRVARALANMIGAKHIEGDEFANKFDDPPAYPACIRQAELDAAIGEAIASGAVVVLDAVCLDHVAPFAKWGRGSLVYVKQLSFNNATAPMWSAGFDLEDDPPADEVHRSVHLYHVEARPHERADLILEMPEEGHSLPNSPFDREHCFDPVGAAHMGTHFRPLAVPA